VGARIRAQRDLMKLTPAAFAARLGCAPDLILRYESGDARAGAAVLMTLAQLCQVRVGYFLAGLDDGCDRAPPETPAF
jgi:transcriptional regulator with XRE-family HTH domain